MNIAIPSDLLAHPSLTGVEKYLFHLLHGLVAIEDVRATLVCPPPAPSARLPETVSVQEHVFPHGLDGGFLFPWIQTPGSLERFDLIHYPTVIAPIWGSPGRRLPMVMTVHDLVPILFPECSTFPKRVYYRFFLKHLFRKIHRFIVPSHAVQKDLLTRFNIRPQRIRVVYEGVSEFYEPGNEKKQDYVLAVSTLEPRKNFKRVIDTFIGLKSSHRIKEDLVIVGKKGWSYKEIFNIPEQFCRNIIFKGYVSDQELLKLYQRAKIFVYPSLYEGFGLPVLEAMACGCPVITSKVSSLPEVAGKAALLVNPYRQEELAEAILTLLQDEPLARECRVRGLEQARKFTWEKCAHETVEVYRSVLKPWAARRS